MVSKKVQKEAAKVLQEKLEAAVAEFCNKVDIENNDELAFNWLSAILTINYFTVAGVHADNKYIFDGEAAIRDYVGTMTHLFTHCAEEEANRLYEILSSNHKRLKESH